MTELLNKLPLSFYVSMGVSFLISLIIVKAKIIHVYSTLDFAVGIQKIHTIPTPRIGGVAVFIAVSCAYLWEDDSRTSILGPLILSGSTAFIFGLIEDLTKQVSISVRLLATIFAGFIGWAITGVSITRLGIDLLDPLFKNQHFSIIFTALAVGGIANAINIIDGLNGLASSMMIIALISVAAISYSVGDTNLAIASLIVSSAIFGFFLVNWPFGKLFMGDGGSYFGGFALAWGCVLLVERNQSISPFSGLLVCIYPFSEVVFSIYRRYFKAQKAMGPDLQHLHSLIYRRYISTIEMKVKENSLAGLLIGFLSAPPALTAYIFYDNNTLCFLGVIFFIMCYIILYMRIVRFKWL
jgi:UDP-N-acetylmuramyl pentapeptide phosphotransferase/UDP-N-acetylglucosamine-1-phosphate transferase